MRTRLVVVTTASAILAIGYFLRQPAVPPAAAAPLRVLCGNERWPVKTFSDADRFKVNLTPRSRTIKQLNSLIRAPHRPQNGRVPGEFSVYRVTGTVMAMINEDDGDVHLALIADDGSKLITEAPEPACSVNARDRTVINKARLIAQNVQPGEKVVAVGVGFFDFAHNQIGHAANYIELHPLLSLRRL